jgi:uncharacterized protein (DUF4415 family)
VTTLNPSELKRLDDTPPWDWSEDTGTALIEVLRDRGAGEPALQVADSATFLQPDVRRFCTANRVDVDILRWFRETGPRYQSRMNAVLRSYVTRMKDLRPATTARTRRTSG